MKLQYKIFANQDFSAALTKLLKDPFDYKEKIRIVKMTIDLDKEKEVFNNLRKSLIEVLTEVKNRYDKKEEKSVSELQAIPEIQEKQIQVNEELEKFTNTEFEIDYEKITLSENTLLTAFDIVALKDILILPE